MALRDWRGSRPVATPEPWLGYTIPWLRCKIQGLLQGPVMRGDERCPCTFVIEHNLCCSPGQHAFQKSKQMAKIEFSLQLASHVDCPASGDLQVGSLREGLNYWFEKHPKLSGYLLDDEGQLRGHLSVFIDGQMAVHSEALDAHISDEAEVFVMQAISGG